MTKVTKNTSAIASVLQHDEHMRAIADEKFVEQQRLKRANGNGLWLELREAIVTECNDLNREMGKTIARIDETASHTLKVRTTLEGQPRVLVVVYEKEGLYVDWTCEQRGAHWHIVTMGDGRLTFARGQIMEPIRTDEVAGIMIRILFNLE